MTQLVACFSSLGCTESESSSVRQGLIAAGIDLIPFKKGTSDHPCVICFADSIDNLLVNILNTTRECFARVIAIAPLMKPAATPVWRVLHAGASDVLTWDSSGTAAQQIASRLERWLTIDQLAHQACRQESIIGKSPAWRTLIRNVVEAAHFTTTPLLLLGESGTGKELLARLVSAVTRSPKTSAHPQADLVTVDCTTLVPDLSGSELFGHERGAFTGAHSTREGAFALADGGTLHLDEIGDLPLAIQAQLLRAIQEKTYKRVGGNTWQTTNFRLVCSTNHDLEELVRRRQFRLDLYHRIAGYVFHMVPLRERTADILALARHFLAEAIPTDTPEFDAQVREYLLNRCYSGNVRELRQLIHRMAIRYSGAGAITAGSVPEEDRPSGGTFLYAWPDGTFEASIETAIRLGVGLKEICQASSQIAIRIAITNENGNLQRAAARLKVTDRALQMRRAAGQLEALSLP
jgi:transcriptional regulator with GAF, ATPase, and Fis domain